MERWIEAVDGNEYKTLVPYPFEWDANGKLICSDRPMLSGPPAPDPSTDTGRPVHSTMPTSGWDWALRGFFGAMSITALIVIVLSNKGAI